MTIENKKPPDSEASATEAPQAAVHSALNLDGEVESVKAYYAKWAESYDDDLVDDYTGSRVIVDLLNDFLDHSTVSQDANMRQLPVADVGCGTGQVGVYLAESGFTAIDGMDLSAEMIEIARQRGVYRELTADVDLNQPLAEQWRGNYATTLCCGVFTLGHVQPEALQHLVTITRPGGLVLTSTRCAYYDDSDYQAVTDRLLASGQASLEAVVRDAPYTRDSHAHYWIYRVRGQSACRGTREFGDFGALAVILKRLF